jgi:hypothetical protein
LGIFAVFLTTATISYEGVDAKWIAIIELSRSDYMAALIYPDVDFDDLVLAMEWFYWAFFIDDSESPFCWKLHINTHIPLAVDNGQLSHEGIENVVRMYEEVQMNRDIVECLPLPLIIEMFQAIWFKICQKNRPCESYCCVPHRPNESGFESLFATSSINYARGLPELDKMRHDAGIPDLETCE